MLIWAFDVQLNDVLQCARLEHKSLGHEGNAHTQFKQRRTAQNHFVNEKVDKHSYRIHLSCVYGYTLRPCLIFNGNLCAAIIINALIKMRRIVNTKTKDSV